MAGEGASNAGSDWRRRKALSAEVSGIPRMLLMRSWYLLAPLVGIALANQLYVHPEVKQVRSQQWVERRVFLGRIDSTRVEVMRVQSQAVRMRAELDTLHLPAVRLLSDELSQLQAIHRMYVDEAPRRQARIDSLITHHAAILAAIDELDARVRAKSLQLDSLRAGNERLVESLAGLDARISAATTALDRLRNPREYRRREVAGLRANASVWPADEEARPR